MPRNQQSKSNTSAQLSVRCEADLKEQYKDAIGDTAMSDDLRQYMKRVVDENGGDTGSGDGLPNDDELRQAYLRLDKLASPDDHRVDYETAESDLASELNRPKKTIRRAIIQPLRRRGYLTAEWGIIKVATPEQLAATDGGEN